MSIPANLRKIQTDLIAAISEDDPDLDAVRLAARRIDMQAEMLELGLDHD